MDQNDVVLITGVTGFTGQHLARQLAQRGVQIRAIARSSSNRSKLEDVPIEWYIGDVYDEDTVAKATDGVNYIFHVAAAYREAKIDDSVYHKVHVESTKLLAQYALRQSNFKRFLHTSTIGVHGHIEDPPADEEYRFAPGDIYQDTKTEAELWIREFAPENRLPLTVVRPAAIYGPGDERLLKLYRMAKLPLIPLIGFGHKNLYHLVHVYDLCESMICLSELETTLGQVYICGNESSISLRDMEDYIAALMNKKAKFIKLPVSPLFWLAWLFESTFPRLGLEPPLYKRRVAFFTKDRCFNTEKIHNVENIKFKYDNRSGLKDTYEWYLEAGWL